MASNKNQSAIESNNTFMVKMEDLVKEIIIQSNIPYYRIESKMDNSADGNYLPVIRIITYFEDSVSRISDIIRAEFDVDNHLSLDKKKVRMDSFSYKHLQFMATLRPSRQSLIEYRRAGNKKFEIQVCSMLQDAWAGIEKELGYDNASFPEELKRDFYRVGALLEMADLEFLKIRSVLGSMNGGLGYAAAPAPQPAVADSVPVVATPVYAVPPPTPPPVVDEYIPQTPAPAAVQPPVAAVPEPQPVVNVAPPAPPVFELPVISEPIAEVVPVITEAVTVPHIPAAPAPTVLDTLNMDVNKPESLSIHVNNSEDTNGTPVDKIPEIITDLHSVPQTTLATDSVSGAAGIANDAVALNIDKVETFNMNVNGMIERHTETIVDKSAEEAKNIPFYNQDPKPVKAIVLDENAQMTDATLKEYVMTSNLLKEVDSEIARLAGATLNAEVDIEGDVERLRFLKVYSLKQLHERIMDNKTDIVLFAEKWIGKDNGGSFDSGICLFYLEYLLVGKKNDPAFAVEYVLKFISDNDYSARFIIPTYNAISKSEPSSIASHLTLR